MTRPLSDSLIPEPVTWNSLLRTLYPKDGDERSPSLWRTCARQRFHNAVNTFTTEDCLRVIRAVAEEAIHATRAK